MFLGNHGKLIKKLNKKELPKAKTYVIISKERRFFSRFGIGTDKPAAGMPPPLENCKIKKKVGEEMSKSSIERVREAEVLAVERRKILSEELERALSDARSEAEKEVEAAQEKAERFVSEERIKSEKEAEKYLSDAVSRAKTEAEKYCFEAGRNANKAIQIIIAGITEK